MQFGTGRIVDRIDELAALAKVDGPWVVIDGYHAFMALDRPLGHAPQLRLSILAEAINMPWRVEGACFMHAPPGTAPRPAITGWFAEFEDLSLPPVPSAMPAMRGVPGATF